MRNITGDISHTSNNGLQSNQSVASPTAISTADDHHKRHMHRFKAMTAAIVLALCAGGITAYTRITPAQYLKQAQSLQPLGDDINAISQSVASMGRQLSDSTADSGTQATDAAAAISNAATTLSDHVDAHRKDRLFSRDSTAADKYSAFADAAHAYASAAAAYAHTAEPLAAASLACQGAGVTLTVGDNVQFLTDYGSYLDSCSAALDALDSADSADSTDQSAVSASQQWSESTRKFVSSQRVTLTALQQMGSTSDMPLDTFSTYLTKLGTLSAASAPDATQALQSWSSTLTSLDPAESLHEVESYLYQQSAR